MEKFAVDLDKVLDEFEFNEDRAEQLANVLPKRSAAPRHHAAPAPPPYRRAPFEPVVLADADYSAAPQHSAATNHLDMARQRQSWNVRNTLRLPGGGSDDPPPAYSVAVPNNINEGPRYESISYGDDGDSMEHKPIAPKWARRDNRKPSANVNVSGVFSSLDDYVNAGAAPPRDVKTVVNDLAPKNKTSAPAPGKAENGNPAPGVARNLPDVASTSNGPHDPVDPPPGTFDLVTNLDGKERTPPPPGVASGGGVSVERAGGDVEALDSVFKTFEIRNIKNITTLRPSNEEVTTLAGTHAALAVAAIRDAALAVSGEPDRDVRPSNEKITTFAGARAAEANKNAALANAALAKKNEVLAVSSEPSNEKITTSTGTRASLANAAMRDAAPEVRPPGEETAEPEPSKPEPSKPEPARPAVGFARSDEDAPSDEALLDLLCDMERELEGGGGGGDDVPPPADLPRDLDTFCNDASMRAHSGDESDETAEVSALKGEGEGVGGGYKSMHSAIRSAGTPPPAPAAPRPPSDPSVGSDSPVPASITSESGTATTTPGQSSDDESSRGDRSRPRYDSDATSTTDEEEGGGGISAGAAAELEMQADARRGAVVEVRSPMVQSPRDGNAIHVLGEEERPTRPKYLFLPSKITMGNNGTSEEGEASSDEEGTPASQVGPAGATPHAHPCGELTDNRPLADEENRNTIVAADETTTTTTAMTAGGETERLDNRANAEALAAADGDANLSSPDYSESSVETPPPIALPPPDPAASLTDEDRTLGFVSPFWIPDNEAGGCMLCDARFTVLRRRHHCRACGKVLCSKCCGLKARLEYMDNAEGRVCQPCHDILLRVLLEEHGEMAGSPTHPSATGGRQPHPNNPMDYCSTVPPMQQVAGAMHNPTPSVLVPVGVLKRQGSARPKSDVAKQVMFSDGIRPGGDLTELDGSGEPRVPFRRPGRVAKRVATPPGPVGGGSPRSPLPPLDPKTLSYIPSDRGLPPVATLIKGELRLDDDMDEDILLSALRADDEPPVMFAVNRNLYVNVKILNLSCCVNRLVWCFTTQGLRCVSQDEVMLVLELQPDELAVPRDVFCYFNTLYQDAVKGSTVSDLGCTLLTGPFLGSADHGAFVYIRPSFQCLRRFTLPTAPYLVAILVHRSETPWARVFPIRLVLRLGAECRYYPCSLVSARDRRPVYREVGHTIVNLLADFRNLSYTLPSVRGLVIHMEDRRTAVLLPRNRYDQVTRALNNSNEHVLALAANLSLTADSHLVCVQSPEDLSYHTQAINIHSKPRRVTGASFVVFNGALKTSSNLTAKSSIVEDGLMVQITPDTMLALRGALRNMKDWSVGCGPTGAPSPDETVSVQWVDDDKNFNVGVCSVIDGRCLDGVPSIRVHNGTDYLGRSRLVRWTEVFILKSDEGGRTGDPLDVGRLSESIARAVCHALVKLLDLLAQAECDKFAIRASVHPDNVCYEGGSRGETLPPIYMNSLDNELVPVLHAAATASENTSAVLELVFHVLLQ